MIWKRPAALLLGFWAFGLPPLSHFIIARIVLFKVRGAYRASNIALSRALGASFKGFGEFAETVRANTISQGRGHSIEKNLGID